MNENIELTNEQKKELKKEAKKIINEENNINENKEEKINKIFHKIWFLELTAEEKENTWKEIAENIKIDKLYLFEIFLSTSIITLWLLQNSTAVVIGWMLIAPLLRPINWLSFSIARWWQSNFIKSFSMLFYSIILSIFLSFFITKIVWIWETDEILARTNPNLIDFFIAIFSGIFWVLWIKFKRIFSSASWVAIAVSLLPPICVVWIELAYGKYNEALWAFLLFGSNILWIILASTIFFWIYGFNPHEKNLQTKVFKRLMIFLFSLIIILIPLGISYTSILNWNLIISETKNIFENNLKSENFEIKNIKILKNNSEILELKINLSLEKEQKNIFEKIKKDLEEKFWKKVEIIFDISKFYKI